MTDDPLYLSAPRHERPLKEARAEYARRRRNVGTLLAATAACAVGVAIGFTAPTLLREASSPVTLRATGTPVTVPAPPLPIAAVALDPVLVPAPVPVPVPVPAPVQPEPDALPASTAPAPRRATPPPPREDPPVVAARRPARPIERPSFDCSQAGSAAEAMICEEPGLAREDRRLEAAYRYAMQVTADPGRIEREQNRWLAERDQLGADYGAVFGHYERRIDELWTGDE